MSFAGFKRMILNMTKPLRIPAHDLTAITAHLRQFGWAIAADVLNPQGVINLKDAVEAACPATSDTSGDFAVIERAPALLDLLRNRRFLDVMRACIGDEDVVVHRSAALRRPPGTPGVHWHTDYDGYGDDPTTPNARLNRGEWPNGAWFYLNGCCPERGGLAVMAGSHVPGWKPPETWSFDLPGVVSIHAEPGDLIMFSARTWHAAHPLTGIIRHSTGIAMRPAAVTIPMHEETPAATQRFIASLPADVAPFFRNYAGWLPDPR